jgi:hypothetical protein
MRLRGYKKYFIYFLILLLVFLFKFEKKDFFIFSQKTSINDYSATRSELKLIKELSNEVSFVLNDFLLNSN